jgi:hypothetical protein
MQYVLTRETREEGVVPADFETKVNGNSQNKNECFYGCVVGGRTDYE